jgi:hypothetical protein
MVSETERAKILEMIEDGTITAEQGLSLLNALDDSLSPDDEDLLIEPEVYLEEIETIHPTDYLDGTETEESLAELVNLSAAATLPSTSPNIPALSVAESEKFQETAPPQGKAEPVEPDQAPPSVDEINKWKRWWVIPFWIGAAITVIGGLLMYWAFSANGLGFWFACAWFPFLFGVAALALAWSSRTTPWLHVRVHQAPGETPRKIAISFPIPIRLTAWGLRVFGHHIPHMEGTNLDEMILALRDVAKDGTPFFVDVNEGEDGEHVQVFIG